MDTTLIIIIAVAVVIVIALIAFLFAGGGDKSPDTSTSTSKTGRNSGVSTAIQAVGPGEKSATKHDSSYLGTNNITYSKKLW